jgi:hypothetical protein
VVFAPVRLAVFDAEVGEADLVVVVRQVVVVGPFGDLPRRPIGMAVVVVALSVALVQPALIVALQLVVQHDAVDACAALLEARCDLAIGSIEVGVVFELARLLEPRGVLLASTSRMVATMPFEKLPAFAREGDSDVAAAVHSDD